MLHLDNILSHFEATRSNSCPHRLVRFSTYQLDFSRHFQIYIQMFKWKANTAVPKADVLNSPLWQDI